MTMTGVSSQVYLDSFSGLIHEVTKEMEENDSERSLTNLCSILMFSYLPKRLNAKLVSADTSNAPTTRSPAEYQHFYAAGAPRPSLVCCMVVSLEDCTSLCDMDDGSTRGIHQIGKMSKPGDHWHSLVLGDFTRC